MTGDRGSIQRVEDSGEKYPDLTNLRWHAIKMLEYDQEVLKDHQSTKQIVRSFEKGYHKNTLRGIGNQECLFNKEENHI
ncbi:MAG: hypothetical protein ACLTFJ_13780 [Clostridium sp.]